MCTAISDNGNHHLFGRTLDLESSFEERVVITPQKFRLRFHCEKTFDDHLAIIGMACIYDNIPLYYDAMNEHGLAVAALNFPNCAVYRQHCFGMYNVASFELIPWILCQCKTLSDAAMLLKKTNITQDDFSAELPATQLHWIIADKHGAVTVEPVAEGLKIYENELGVLTNSPNFPYHIFNSANYMSADSTPPRNTLAPTSELPHYSRGMGGICLPGDFSSSSRFVRALFAKNHTVPATSWKEEISRFFHIMDIVSQPHGCVLTKEGKKVRTIYTSCADTSNIIYYFTSYTCRRIHAVNLMVPASSQGSLITFPIAGSEDILDLN